MLSIVGFMSGICALTDLKSRKIFNIITIPGMLIGAIYWFINSGISGFMTWGLGLLLGGGLLILPFIYGYMGAGDVKMMAMIGALAGPAFALNAFFWSSIFGGVLGLFYLWILRKSKKDYIPYGVAISSGVFVEILRVVGML